MDHGLCLLIQLLVLGLQIHTNEGLERSQINAIVNENCTRYITTQHEGLKFTAGCIDNYSNNSHMDLISLSTNTGELMCPPWYQKNGVGKCEVSRR